MGAQLAIDGGPQVRTAPFPPWPVLGPDDASAVAEALRSGQLTQLTGPYVGDFERAFAEWHGVDHCIATSSGTSAIHTALATLGIGPGDEVIVPAHTFIASATPVLHQGGTPVFADVDENTFCVSPDSVRDRITDHTKAIVAVHLNGHPCDMDALGAIASEQGVALVEDAAQAHGAQYRGRKAGTIGTVGCFSFWEDKIITTGGEGGAVITRDGDLAERMRRFRHHGEGPVEGSERAYFHLGLGYNYRMTSMQAATGLVQLGHLNEYLVARRRNAAYLSERLGELAHIEPPFVADYAVHSYYKYICRLRPESGIDIGRFVAAVAAEGVPISRRYPTPLPHQPVFREAGLGGEPCPVAERLSGELFTLLVHPTVETGDLDDYVGAIRKVINTKPVNLRNEKEVEDRIVKPLLKSMGWEIDASGCQVWIQLTPEMAELWRYASKRMCRDYVLGGSRPLHVEAKHRWSGWKLDLGEFCAQINHGDWSGTERDGARKDLALLLWGALASNAHRAAILDESRIATFEWNDGWGVVAEAELSDSIAMDPVERFLRP